MCVVCVYMYVVQGVQCATQILFHIWTCGYAKSYCANRCPHTESRGMEALKWEGKQEELKDRKTGKRERR